MFKYLIIGFSLYFFSFTYADTFKATVIRIVDGDTFHVKQSNGHRQKIRLFGIDAPELSQKDGPQSGRFLASRIGGETVTIKVNSTDKYKRIVAIVYDKNGKNLNEDMIRLGLAWVSPKHTKNPQWLKFQSNARSKKLGLWRRKSPVPPWKFRHQ